MWIKTIATALLGMQLAVTPAHAQRTVTVRVALSEAMAPASFVEDGQASGMLKDMLKALFRNAPGYQAEFHAFPWTRAQRMVEAGEMDMFVTFPSGSRKEYADFSPHAIYTLDYGNIIYDRTSSKSAQIEAARSFEDLKGLTFISQESIAWEVDNIPPHIQRYMVNGPPSLLHMTFQRKRGDFFIMPAEQAVYLARQFGYAGQLGMKKVSFIPNSQVEFHVGVRKTHPKQKELLAVLNRASQSPGFIAQRKAIERKYRELAIAGPQAKPPSSPPS